jgi:hypothetical protein
LCIVPKKTNGRRFPPQPLLQSRKRLADDQKQILFTSDEAAVRVGDDLAELLNRKRFPCSGPRKEIGLIEVKTEPGILGQGIHQALNSRNRFEGPSLLDLFQRRIPKVMLIVDGTRTKINLCFVRWIRIPFRTRLG